MKERENKNYTLIEERIINLANSVNKNVNHEVLNYFNCIRLKECCITMNILVPLFVLRDEVWENDCLKVVKIIFRNSTYEWDGNEFIKI